MNRFEDAPMGSLTCGPGNLDRCPVYECHECGALVIEPSMHDRWHVQVSNKLELAWSTAATASRSRAGGW